MFEEPSISLSPINFFQIGVDCFYIDPAKKSDVFWLNAQNHQKYLLPNTSALCNQEHFADVALGWNQEGIEAFVKIKEPFQQIYYPEIAKGDSVELFIDTRDVKTSGYNTRFCHHFFFLPEAAEGHVAGELTRFRTEDRHELCDPKELQVKATFKESSYQLNLFIPSQCLHGYDPDQFKRMGFTYRINRATGGSQHFSVTSEEYQIEQQPSLWSSVLLK